MLRGGSWNNNPDNCRSANRNRNTRDNINNTVGFRVVSSASCTLLKPLCNPWRLGQNGQV
ncbi:MAG: SUMF1/EgtB/PvdO family nonheme iron enzyme [Cyanobacteria bacterium J06632_22]